MHSIKLIYDYFSPAYRAGGPTQSLANMVDALDLPLSVIATNSDLDGSLLDVETDQWLSLPGRKTLSTAQPNAGIQTSESAVWYCSPQGLNIDALINPNDILLINSIFSHHFNYPALIKGKASRKIISPRGMLDPGSLSQKSWKKQLYLAWWKLRGLDRLVEWHATNELEKKNILAVFGNRAKVWVAPNFPRIIDFQPKEKQAGALRMASIAVISPMKNHLLVLEALKDFKNNLIWDIWGPVKDAQYWSVCKTMMEKMPPNVTVNYHGDVPPPEVPAALQNAHIAMLPSKSENFGHSIFEALTAGMPVVTSHNTPWNNLAEGFAGQNVSIADGREILMAIKAFSDMDQKTYDQWSMAARAFALQAVDIAAIAQNYRDMFSAKDE